MTTSTEPTTLRGLKVRATNRATDGDHELRPWLNLVSGTVAHTRCRRCNGGACVNLAPSGPYADISGGAVSATCAEWRQIEGDLARSFVSSSKRDILVEAS